MLQSPSPVPCCVSKHMRHWVTGDIHWFILKQPEKDQMGFWIPFSKMQEMILASLLKAGC